MVTQLFALEEVDFLVLRHERLVWFSNRPLSGGQRRHLFICNVTVFIFLFMVISVLIGGF